MNERGRTVACTAATAFGGLATAAGGRPPAAAGAGPPLKLFGVGQATSVAPAWLAEEPPASVSTSVARSTEPDAPRWKAATLIGPSGAAATWKPPWGAWASGLRDHQATSLTAAGA